MKKIYDSKPQHKFSFVVQFFAAILKVKLQYISICEDFTVNSVLYTVLADVHIDILHVIAIFSVRK